MVSVAKRTELTSDVTRFRGVAIAAILASLATVLAAVVLSGKDTMRGSPGPLSPAHASAGLACEQCHQADRAAPSACTGCHGDHASTRNGHQTLARAGELVCSHCHQAHGGSGGVTLLADGRAIRYGAGGEVEVALSVGYRAAVETRVPILVAGACGRCHDISAVQDPISVCLVPGQASLGARRPSLCFDEHTRPGGERDAAWEAARQVAAISPLAPAIGRARFGPWSWLGIGGIVGLVVIGATRLRSRSPRKHFAKQVLVRAPELLRLPTINSATCLGCHACVDACPFDVLEIRRYVAVVARPEACCGLTLCEQRCPNGSLLMGDGTLVAGALALDDSLQSAAAPGIYLAGDVTGLPLIRNAINQGAHALRALADELGRHKSTLDLDVVIVGAGPAGISAALEAKSRGLRYVTLEQNTVAGSIQSFPRAKLVFDQPLDLPLVGQLWLEESSKEELLARWLRIVRSEKLAIREGLRVAHIDPIAQGGFAVHAVDDEGAEQQFLTQRVLLAIGKRGSPRELGVDVPGEMADRVFYSLADARTFAGKRVMVVGLGDVAMEAAIALSRQPDTSVVLSYRGSDFSRGKARNIEELRRRVVAGGIDLRLQTSVSRIANGLVTLNSSDGEVDVSCDCLFVLIGTIPPTEFLTRAGVVPSPVHNASDMEIET